MGLSLSWALNIATWLPMTFKLIADTETQMNSVHRIILYLEQTPNEAPYFQK